MGNRGKHLGFCNNLASNGKNEELWHRELTFGSHNVGGNLEIPTLIVRIIYLGFRRLHREAAEWELN